MVTEEQARKIYRESIHIDGLNICNFGPGIFRAWNRGGITAVSCTCGLWENFRDSIKNVIQWKKWFEEYEDLIIPVHTVKDIYKAKKEKKTGVILSWQNTSGIEDQINYLMVFEQLGIKIMQLTYNTQNYSGAGYTEINDSGITGFGKKVLEEMSRVGVAVDLSHVGHNTTMDSIKYSPKPPCFSHVLPASQNASGRNKTDQEIKAIREKGGIVAASCFGPNMKKGNDSTIDDYVDVLDYYIDLVGVDHVGIGSDASEGYARPSSFLEWCNMDKGYAYQMTAWGSKKVVKPLGKLEEREELAVAMARKGWSEEKIKKVLGLNWIKYFNTVWN